MKTTRWRFVDDGKELEIAVHGHVVTDDGAVLVDAALDGLGVAYVFESMARPHITEKRLVRVLDRYCPQIPGYFLYYPSRANIAPKLKALVGSASWLAASCVAGKCADSVTSCGRTRSRYCAGGAVIVTPSPAAQCGNRTGTSTCDVCINTNCCAARLACDAKQSCRALASCDATCGANTDCRQRCYSTYSSGTADLNTLNGCVAPACGAGCKP